MYFSNIYSYVLLIVLIISNKHVLIFFLIIKKKYVLTLLIISDKYILIIILIISNKFVLIISNKYVLLSFQNYGSIKEREKFIETNKRKKWQNSMYFLSSYTAVNAVQFHRHMMQCNSIEM